MSVAVPIKAVILDVDGTLLTLRQPLGEVYAAVLQAHGVSCSPQTLHAVIKRTWAAFRDEYLNVCGAHATTHAREEAVWKQFVREVLAHAGVSTSATHGEVIIQAIYDHYSAASTRVVVAGAMEFLQLMGSLSLPTVAATNNDRRTVQVLRECGLASLLSDIKVCGDIGWKKPSVLFFHTLADHLGVACENILHVGNDPNLDVEAAKVAGMQSVLFRLSESIDAEGVTSFEQLAAFVERRR